MRYATAADRLVELARRLAETHDERVFLVTRQRTRDGAIMGLVFHRSRPLAQEEATGLSLWPPLATEITYLAIAVAGLSLVTFLTLCFALG
jgi:hypothetical protein